MSISISPELERRLIEQATAAGYSSVESYLIAIVSREGEAGLAESVVVPPTGAELDALLESLAFDEPVPPLPADFSRADIYADHDL